MAFLSKHVKDIHQLMNLKSQGLCFTSHTTNSWTLRVKVCVLHHTLRAKSVFLLLQPLQSILHWKGRESVKKDDCTPGVKRNDFNSHSGTLEGASNIPSFLHPSSRVTWAAAGARRLVAEVGIAAGALSAAVQTAAPTPSCLTSHYPGCAPGAVPPRGKLHPLKTTGTHRSPGRGPTVTCQRPLGASNSGQKTHNRGVVLLTLSQRCTR